MRHRMDREKVAGENFREGRMEVTFELWAERNMLSRFQRRSHRYQGKRYRKSAAVVPLSGTETGSWDSSVDLPVLY